jgi:hypothetical protein
MTKMNSVRIFYLLVAFIILLIAAHLAVSLSGNVPDFIRTFFDLDEESNLPTWFSSFQFLTLASLSLLRREQIKGHAAVSLIHAYEALGAVFLFLSMDETACFHENITAFGKLISVHSPLPNGHGLWIFAYPVVALFVLFVFRKIVYEFIRERKARSLFILGGFVYILGVAGFELSGYYLTRLGLRDIYKFIEVPLEEGCELLGQTIMIKAMLAKIGQSEIILKIR